MKNNILFGTDCYIYPGGYVPLVNKDQRQAGFKPHENANAPMPFNLTELADSFILELAIPGVNREDFQILADENVLSVWAVHQACAVDAKTFQSPQMDDECYGRNIVLPDNADAEFVSAEYKAGVLRLYVTKTNQPAKNLHARIVVY